jgi:hypothetical protein
LEVEEVVGVGEEDLLLVIAALGDVVGGPGTTMRGIRGIH